MSVAGPNTLVGNGYTLLEMAWDQEADPTSDFEFLRDPAISSGGQVAFSAVVSDEQAISSSIDGIFRVNFGFSPVTIALPNRGDPDSIFSLIGPVDIRSSGHVVFSLERREGTALAVGSGALTPRIIVDRVARDGRLVCQPL